MIQCPRCGHENPDGSMNCVKCCINLQYALANYEQLRSQWQEENERRGLLGTAERQWERTTGIKFTKVGGKIRRLAYLFIVVAVLQIPRILTGPSPEQTAEGRAALACRQHVKRLLLGEPKDASFPKITKSSVHVQGGVYTHESYVDSPTEQKRERIRFICVMHSNDGTNFEVVRFYFRPEALS